VIPLPTDVYSSGPVSECNTLAIDKSLYVGMTSSNYPVIDTNNLLSVPSSFTGLTDPESNILPSSFSVIIDSDTSNNGGSLLTTGIVALGNGAIIPKYVNATGKLQDLGYASITDAAPTSIDIFANLPNNAVVPKAYVDAKFDMLQLNERTDWANANKLYAQQVLLSRK